MKRIVLLGIALAGLVGAGAASAGIVESVRHEGGSLEASGRGEARVLFRLTQAARVDLELFDGRDLLIGRVESKGGLEAGDRSLVWSGLDLKGKPVPAEAYRYRLVARATGAKVETWDPVDDVPGTRTGWVESKWDAGSKSIRYSLRQPSRVRVRVGIVNSGPLLRTVIDWVPRAAGEQRELWDGKDTSGLQDYSSHPGIDVVVEAFALPVNTILVGPRPREVVLIRDWPSENRVEPGAPQFEMFDFARQSITTRRDFPLQLSVPAGLPRDANGRVIATGPVPILLAVEEAQATALLNERFEVVYFVDERMVFETESGFFPITWTWDPKNESPGEHSIHVNLRGFDGHFGMATILTFVK